MRAVFVLAAVVVMCLSMSSVEASNPADVDGDGIVDMRDIAVVCENWLWEAPAPDPCEFAVIPGGTFEMGDSFAEGGADEQPVHIVTVDSFYMGRYEVTNQQYCDFLNTALAHGLIIVVEGVVYKAGSGMNCVYCDTFMSGSYCHLDYNEGLFYVKTKSGRSMINDPVVRVTWYGAVAYCNWKGQQLGKELCYDDATLQPIYPLRNGIRLPTEAEWERAARAGLSGRRFPLGDTIDHRYADYSANGSAYIYDTSPYTGYTYHPDWNDGIFPYTSPVGSFPANEYGLYNLAANVHEWCNDWYLALYYYSTPRTNPRGPLSGTCRVIRGGAWAGPADLCRIARRVNVAPDFLAGDLGFRVALNVE